MSEEQIIKGRARHIIETDDGFILKDCVLEVEGEKFYCDVKLVKGK